MTRNWQWFVVAWGWLGLLAGCSLSGGLTPAAQDQPVVRPAVLSPQMVGATVFWSVPLPKLSVDEVYEFILADGTEEESVQKGKAREWRWQPEKAGRYRVKVVVEDAAGLRREGEWSKEFVIVAGLHRQELVADRPSPQPAGSGVITWQATVTGGVPPLSYEFISQRQGREVIEQQGEKSSWQWRPEERGTYRLTVRVHDGAGNILAGELSADYEIAAPLRPDSLIAVLPVQNLSGDAAPLTKIQEHLEEMLRQQGMRLVEAPVMRDFIRRHRLRYTAGVEGSIALALREETGADAVLLSSVELYREEVVPKISLTAWLDRCEDPARILWMDSVSLTGDEAPGLLNLQLVRDADQLLDKALKALFVSWSPTLLPFDSEAAAKKAEGYWEKRWRQVGGRRFKPQHFYRSDSYSAQHRYTVAVMPFYNLSERKHAGDLMALHLVRQLRQLPNLSVVEPGELRQNLLRYRIIMDDGLSLASAEVLFAALGVDLVVTGKVFDYADYIGMIGKPMVDFSMEVFSQDGNNTLWTSKSHVDGEKWVYFFDLGKVYTAHGLAAQMAGTIVKNLGQ